MTTGFSNFIQQGGSASPIGRRLPPFSLAFQPSEKRVRQIRVRATRFLREHTIFERFRRSDTHQNGFDFQRLEEIQTIPPRWEKRSKGNATPGEAQAFTAWTLKN